MKVHYLLSVCIFISTYSTASTIDVEKIREKLSQLLQDKNVPPQVAKWIAVLHDSVGILKCAPTIRQGNCVKSVPCQLPKLKFDKVVSIVLTICKNPYKIVIDFMPLDLPWYAKLNLHPIVINFNNDEKNGIFTVHSDTEIKAHVKHTHFHTGKARFMIEGSIRYDCTKPRGNSNWMQRALLNMAVPNKQYNKIFYRLKIRIELKKKRVHWGKFDYKCVKCEDLINRSGTISGAGPSSCIDEVNKYLSYEGGVIQKYKRECYNTANGWHHHHHHHHHHQSREDACIQRCQREKLIPTSRCPQVAHH